MEDATRTDPNFETPIEGVAEHSVKLKPTLGGLFSNYSAIDKTFTVTLPEGEVITFTSLAALGHIRKLVADSAAWAKELPLAKKHGEAKHLYAAFPLKDLFEAHEVEAVAAKLKEVGALIGEDRVNVLPTSREEAGAAFWIHRLSEEPKYSQPMALFIMKYMGWLGSHLIEAIDAHRMQYQDARARAAIDEEGEE